MAWARLDDGFDDNPKVVAMLDEDDQTSAAVAIGLWTLSLSWAHRNTRKRGQTPGLLPAGLPRRFIGAIGKDAAQLLVKHRLWEPQDDGGWLIHDFGEYLPTEETRAARSEAGKRGAAKRWANKAPSVSMANASQDDGKLPSVSHDVDSKPIASDGSRAPARRAISKEIAPVPGPEELFPAPVAALPTPPQTITQRSKRLTDTYSVSVPLCNWSGVNQLVIRAIKTEKWTDEQIEAALARLVEVDRPVTADSLRLELNGPKIRAPSGHQSFQADPKRNFNDGEL